MLKTGIVSADRIVDGSVAAGLVEARRIVEPGSVRRRPPDSVDARVVPWLLRLYQRATFSEAEMKIPPRHLLVLSEARLAGHGVVVVTSGSTHLLLRDSAFELLHFHRGVPPGFERGAAGKLTLPSRVDRRIEPRCLVLKRWWSPNFGHWLVDQAMTLSFLVHRGALDTKHIVIHRVEDARLRRIVRQTINVVPRGCQEYLSTDYEKPKPAGTSLSRVWEHITPRGTNVPRSPLRFIPHEEFDITQK